jgi:AcrR family transcriptional regulator
MTPNGKPGPRSFAPRPAQAAARVTPRRERLRAATIDEIKQTALRLMRESGTIDVRFTDIARAMDLTPPALYRYFADRDALLNVLIADAYGALGRLVAEARDALPADDLGGRFMAVSQAYRRWARSEPQQFALLFGLPLPGYVAPEDGPTTEAARGAMSELSRLFVDARDHGRLGAPLLREAPPAICAMYAVKHADADMKAPDIPAESFQAMLHAWAALHGFTSLEAYGHFDWMGDDAREELFRGLVKQAALVSGIPYE